MIIYKCVGFSLSVLSTGKGEWAQVTYSNKIAGVSVEVLRRADIPGGHIVESLGGRLYIDATQLDIEAVGGGLVH